jgi:hypothetical protein
MQVKSRLQASALWFETREKGRDLRSSRYGSGLGWEKRFAQRATGRRGVCGYL